ncbi:hypothetical protein [Thermus tenuipuniceus]|uniref:hypothetical protein n=1 Tax=Thermus tenuipuniceus TaxID=2078690 RepID=UPI000CF961D4|nr:hypothetical protein [Thermus tenuipuniceus]
MLLEVVFAGLSPWVFWAGVGAMALGFTLGEASWMAWVLLYPWWRLRRGWRLRLFPDHLSLHPPLGLSRRIPLEGVREVGVVYWPAGPLARGRRALVLHLEDGEGIPLPVPDPEGLAARIRELLRGRTSGSGFRDG